jgi:AcrR family transcriptional regulator
MPPPRKKKRIRNPAQTRMKLLRATVDLVADKGHEALSLKEAASKAKLSRGVAYQHFKNRDHLLREAKRYIVERIAAGVKQSEGLPLKERVRHDARLILENREATKVLMADALSGRDLLSNHPLYQLTRRLIEEMVADGKARPDVDVEMLTYILLSTTAIMLLVGESHRDIPTEVLAERFAAEWSQLLERGMYIRAPRR